MSTWQEMLGAEAMAQLLANGKEQAPLKGGRRGGGRDFQPVCKLFLPWHAATWLLTEIEDDGLAFGLADLGFGTPELGYISLDEIWEVVGPGGLRVERDLHFQATMPLSSYAAESRQIGYIRA